MSLIFLWLCAAIPGYWKSIKTGKPDYFFRSRQPQRLSGANYGPFEELLHEMPPVFEAINERELFVI
jgi:hypothetical protein